jgi:hypothetical protein
LAARPRAQNGGTPVIGWISSGSTDGDADGLRAFRHGLPEAGFGNAAIEYSPAEGLRDQLPAPAADLVRRQVSVIANLAKHAEANINVSNTLSQKRRSDWDYLPPMKKLSSTIILFRTV